MKNINITNFLVAVIVTVFIVPAFTFALETQDNGSSAGSVGNPPTQDNGSSAGVSNPSTQDNGSSAGSINNSSTQDNGSSAGVSNPSTQDNGSSAGSINNPPTQDNGSSAGSINNPPTQDNGSSAGVSNPPTQDNGSSAGSVNNPPTQDNGSSAGTNPPPTQDNGSSAGTDNGNNNGGGGNNNRRGGSSGGSRRVTTGEETALPPLINVSQCVYLQSYLKYGWNNPVSEVTKLQAFLRNIEGINVNVTGVFDLQTLSAVHTFQARYLNDVMIPWGVKTTSGFVYYTTTKKINEIFCKKNFTLTPAQIAEIEAYRKNVVNKKPTAPVSEVPANINPATGEVIATSTTPDIGQNNSGTGSQVASPEGTSFGSRVWNFIKWLFGAGSDSTTSTTATSTQN